MTIEKPVKKTRAKKKAPGGILLRMPLVPLRGMNVFPQLAVTFDIARERPPSRLFAKRWKTGR